MASEKEDSESKSPNSRMNSCRRTFTRICEFDFNPWSKYKKHSESEKEVIELQNLSIDDESKREPFEYFKGWGILCALLYSLLVSVQALLVGMVPKISLFGVCFARCFMEMVIASIVLCILREKFPCSKLNLSIAGFRSFFHVLSTFTLFFALQRMQIGDVVAIRYGSPSLVFIFGCIFLKEKCGVMEILSTLLALVGVFLLLHPALDLKDLENVVHFSTKEGLFAWISAMIAAGLTSIQMTLIRRTKDINFAYMIFFSGLLGSLLSSIFGSASIVLEDWVWPQTIHEWFFVVLIGIISFCGQYCFISALSVERSMGSVGVIITLSVIFTYVWGIGILGMIPGKFSVIGTVLILTAALIYAVRLIYNESDILKGGDPYRLHNELEQIQFNRSYGSLHYDGTGNNGKK